MTNIALSALILLIILLPGAIFIRSLNSFLLSRQSTKIIAFDQVVVKGVIYCLIAHLIGLFVIEKIFRLEVDFEFLYKMLVGHKFEELEPAFGSKVKEFGYYSIFQSFLAFLLAKGIKQIQYRSNWTRKINLFNANNYWFEIFNPRYLNGNKIRTKVKATDIICVDVLVDSNVLYCGFLQEYFYCPYSDKLESLVLMYVMKCKPRFEDDPPAQKYLDIDTLIIPYSTVKNISVHYLNVDSVSTISNTPPIQDHIVPPADVAEFSDNLDETNSKN